MLTKQSLRIFILCVFLLPLIFFTGCAEPPGKGDYATVTYIYDGDTVKLVGGEKVRYIGIDTPEFNYPNGPIEHFAREAKEFNRKLVEGKRVRIEFDAQTVDKYGRILAYVYVDDIFVNARIIEEGYARILSIPPNIKYADIFLQLQRKAREAKKGLWAE